MNDRWAVLVAMAAVLGAFVARGPSPWVAGLLALAALVSVRPWLLALGVLLLAGGLAARAEAGLVPVTAGRFEGWVTLLSDPEPTRFGVRADVRLGDGRHLQAEGNEIGTAHAGERIFVSGRLERPPPNASWLAVRHVVGILSVESARARSPGAPWMQAANRLRALLEHGAAVLPTRERPLFLGFVLGDTRGQSPDITDDFRGAGLSHLLAVSGQNVAFVLTLAGPLLRRTRLRARLPATITLIAFFALVTRFEPSVLRASVMAALAVTASTLGREASSIRLLALAVAGLVLVDPFLVRSVGFQLSVGACIGIAVLSPVLARHLPGPRPIVEALAVTLGAQAGVAPLLVSVFGGIPVAAVPANLLAAPLEAPVMVWGLGGGLLAGASGERVATIVHWPTHVMIAAIAAIAHTAASLPFGELHARELVVLTMAGVVAAVARNYGFVGASRLAVAALVIAVLAPAAQLHATPPVRVDIAAGAVLWRAGGVVLDLDGRVDAGDLLEALRRAGLRDIDAVVSRVESVPVRAALDGLAERYSIGRVLSPSSVHDPASFTAGELRIEVRPAPGRLTVEIGLRPTGDARGPPV